MYGSVPLMVENIPLPSDMVVTNNRLFQLPPPTCVAEMPDHFEPRYNAQGRKTTLSAGIFNMIATFLDGTILSLPFAFMNSGLILGIWLIISTAIMTMISIHILTTLARKMQAASFTDLVDKLLGSRLQKLFSSCLFLLLFFTIVGFMIIMKQLCKQILDYFLPDSTLLTIFVLTVCSAIAYPLMLADTLHHIRHACYLGFISIVILLICICYRTTTLHNTEPNLYINIPLWPTSIINIFNAIPIFSLIYVCQLNSLAIYSQLKGPSNTRMSIVSNTSILIVTILFLLFGICGLIILHNSQIITDNILLVFPIDDSMMLLGRISLLVTLVCSLPIFIVPIRHLIIDLLSSVQNSTKLPNSWSIQPPHERFRRSVSFHTEPKLYQYSKIPEYNHTADTIMSNNIEEGKSGLITTNYSNIVSPTISGYSAEQNEQEEEEETESIFDKLQISVDEVDLGMQGIEDTWREYVTSTPIILESPHPEMGSTLIISPRQPPSSQVAHPQEGKEENIMTDNEEFEHEIEYGVGSKQQNYKSRLISTGMLTLLALLTAIFIPNVQFVWALIGSSISIIIAYLMPALCYISLVRTAELKTDITLIYCYVVTVISIGLIMSCNIAYFANLFIGSQ